jgi:hypothetical protein
MLRFIIIAMAAVLVGCVPGEMPAFPILPTLPPAPIIMTTPAPPVVTTASAGLTRVEPQGTVTAWATNMYHKDGLEYPIDGVEDYSPIGGIVTNEDSYMWDPTDPLLNRTIEGTPYQYYNLGIVGADVADLPAHTCAMPYSSRHIQGEGDAPIPYPLSVPVREELVAGTNSVPKYRLLDVVFLGTYRCDFKTGESAHIFYRDPIEFNNLNLTTCNYAMAADGQETWIDDPKPNSGWVFSGEQVPSSSLYQYYPNLTPTSYQGWWCQAK